MSDDLRALVTRELTALAAVASLVGVEEEGDRLPEAIIRARNNILIPILTRIEEAEAVI